MKRRSFLKIPLAFVACSGKGIQEINGPTDEKPSENTIISQLTEYPYATWTSSGKILYCKDKYFKIADQQGSEISDILVLGDNESYKSISHPKCTGDNILYQIEDNLQDTSEIWLRYIYGGVPKKLDFGLEQGKLENPALSYDEKLIAFTYNNKFYFSSLKGKATLIEIDEKIGKWCKWVGMYDWSRDNRLAFVAESDYTNNIFIMDNIILKADNTIDTNSINITPLTKGNFNDCNPSWSLFSDYIAFDSDRDDIAKNENNEIIITRNDIFLIKSDGTNLENLTKTPLISSKPSMTITNFQYTYPRFHPEDNMLIYTSMFLINNAIHLVKNPIKY